MKCKIPEISWHNRDPVLSVDLQPKLERSTDTLQVYRLASGGTDAHVLIWYLELHTETGDVEIELAADLSRHQRAVNAVKWSPNGELLASGDDESVIFIWKQKSETETLNLLENTNEEDKEIWLTMKILRGHMEDVYDLCWAPNSQLLVSGSVDNTAMIWDVHKGKSLAILNDHKGFVQGVAWDPYNKYIATLSTDRYLRIFDIQTRKVVYRVNKCVLPVPEGHELYEKNCRLYHDDTLQTFFRRLTFTPDGKLLITPAGLAEYADVAHSMEASYIYSRYELKQPAIVLPSPEQYTVAVRCCPLLFKLRPHSAENPPVVPLPYRMIFAVATRCSVYFYDTQQVPPFAVISNIHYTRLTDITWSVDGRVVVVSSTDGFCSLISLNKDELGEIYEQTAADLLAQEKVLQNNNNQANKKKQNKNKAVNERKSSTQNSPTLKTQEAEKENNVEFILDKEILSSAEKFQTPAKKTEAATPIAVRRHPRPPAELLASAKVIEKIEESTVEDEASNETDFNMKADDDEDEYFVSAKVMRVNIKDDEEIISDEDEIRSEAEEQSRMNMLQMEVDENVAPEKDDKAAKEVMEKKEENDVNEAATEKTADGNKEAETGQSPFKDEIRSEEEDMQVDESMVPEEMKKDEKAEEKNVNEVATETQADGNKGVEKEESPLENEIKSVEKEMQVDENMVPEKKDEEKKKDESEEAKDVNEEKTADENKEAKKVESPLKDEIGSEVEDKSRVTLEEIEVVEEKELNTEAEEQIEKEVIEEKKENAVEKTKQSNEAVTEKTEEPNKNDMECQVEDDKEQKMLEQQENIQEASAKSVKSKQASEAIIAKENERGTNENAENSVQSKSQEAKTKETPTNLTDDSQKQPLSADKTINGSPLSRPNYLSPSERTPRRVALRTISTPKSKKKLLD